MSLYLHDQDKHTDVEHLVGLQASAPKASELAFNNVLLKLSLLITGAQRTRSRGVKKSEASG